MCWITLTPKRKKLDQHCHDKDEVGEYLIRRDRHKAGEEDHCRDHVRVVTPLDVRFEHHHHLHPSADSTHHHHHRHGHRHHHSHTFKLHGHGRKRTSMPLPPPPTRNSSRHRSRSPGGSSCHKSTGIPDEIYRIKPIDTSGSTRYRTTIVEPAHQEIQETTRIALREARPHRSRGLRRMAGYEVLGRQVPWNWDCVSSVSACSRNDERAHSRPIKQGLSFPPFGSSDSWM